MRGRVNWNLVACTFGHHTYAPCEPELRDHLRVVTWAGEAWRCLRCGAYVPGAPRGGGPADEAPVPLRGQQLRDAFVLRLLAVERAARALMILAGAYGVVQLRAHHDAARRDFEHDLLLLQPFADQIGWGLAESSTIHMVRSVLDAPDATLLWVAAGLAGYGVALLLEGVGLWLLRRWGEYLSAVATSLFIPLEIYELGVHLTWVRVVVLVLNVAAVGYLVYRKRLFGFRGGAAAAAAERHEKNLLQIVRAAGR